MSKDDRELIARLRGRVKYETACGTRTDNPRNRVRLMEEAATRLEALQAQPVGEDALRAEDVDEIVRHACESASDDRNGEYFIIRPDALLKAAGEVAALTASPPVVEREAIALALINEARRFSSLVPVASLNDLEPHQYRDQLRYADAILALTPVEGVGETEAAFNAGWAEAVQCIENEGPMAADHMARDTTWEAYRAALSTPVAQGDEVRDALEHNAIPRSDGMLDFCGCSCGWEGETYFDGDAYAKEAWETHRAAALATLTKGARDAR